MRKIVLITVCLLLGCLFIGWIYLWSLVSQYDEQTDPSAKREVAIVLGAALWDGEPSPALRERLEAALQLYEDGLVARIILSGGEGNDGISEAEGMKRYLTARGVPADDLLLEEEAANTQENLSFSQAILKEAGLTEVYIVTHDYHMYRAMKIAAELQLEAQPVSVHSRVLFKPYHKTRESLALIKYYLVNG
ncbi:YdcF family protein [Desmospora activa]|uniref:Uncharacterized SAM-binding protein YcdF (DUF218 family) n=1 Tax=Desmospora activa DSM 45169 TaxID=1121389 RepID=A0A2T4Z735_9BACL|nr:YdcF family protein [Desmospora activa]PTM57708.1 uncharacterized SAM-binding protein YcdF (DUF218 family) [Desmospora activa DSM 45169]